jgi:hypothetical protein
VLADALSRRPDYEINHLMSIASDVYEMIRDAYDNDTQCSAIRECELDFIGFPCETVSWCTRLLPMRRDVSLSRHMKIYDTSSRTVLTTHPVRGILDERRRTLSSAQGFGDPRCISGYRGMSARVTCANV